MRAGRAHARHDRLTGRGLRHRSQSPRRRPPPIGRGPSHRVCGRGHGTVPNCPHARRAKMVFWSSQFATVSAEWWSCFTSSLQHKPKMAAHGSTLRPQSCSCAIRQRRTSNTCPLDAAAASAYPGPSGSAASHCPHFRPGYVHHGYCWAFGALQGGSRKCYMDPNQTTCGPRLLSLYRRFPTGAWRCRCMVATGKYASVGILLCSQPAREVKPSRRG
jgi:hypothetical protein